MNTKLPENSLILLEGGSLRGLYTAGALDILMEHDLYFPAVAGVSAGALNAYNYVAHQPGRAASINLRYRHDRRYFGPLAAVKGGSLFGLNFLLNDIEKEVPFDEDMFKNGGQRMFAVATCVETGKAVYFEKDQPGLDFKQAVKASASLPLASATATWTAAAPAPSPSTGRCARALTRSSSWPRGRKVSEKSSPASAWWTCMMTFMAINRCSWPRC